MVFWDEAKRKANLKEHGLDFVGCERVFDHAVLTAEDTRLAYEERRTNLIGWLSGMFVHMTYAERGDDLRIISLRYATRHEIENYRKAISRK